MNRTKESEVQLRIATKLNPKDWMAHFELGKLLFDLDRFAAAVDELTTASRTAKPGSDEASRVYRLLGRTYYRMGREDEHGRGAKAAKGSVPLASPWGRHDWRHHPPDGPPAERTLRSIVFTGVPGRQALILSSRITRPESARLPCPPG
jgi:hypothetical protein